MVCSTRSNHCIVCWVLSKLCEDWKDKPIEEYARIEEVDGLIKL